MEIALVGNPNSGKTTVFNHLTGSSQYVGNWPGVTVERKCGPITKKKHILLQDLPGIYSMSPYTPEEIVARDYLLNGKPQAILNVVDATNLERNLYLTTQLMETGIPVCLSLNMMDILEAQKKYLNIEKLSYGLGIPVVSMSALKKKGVEKAVEKAENHQDTQYPTYDNRLEAALDEISLVLGGTVPEKQARWYAIKVFERDEEITQNLDLSTLQKKELEEIIAITEKVFDEDSLSIVINARYDFITQLTKLCLGERGVLEENFSDKVDRIVTNRFLALPIFALIMWLVYAISIQWVGGVGTDWLNEVVFGSFLPERLADFLNFIHVADWLQNLIIDGILAGTGAVLGFLPQIFVLFICLGLLEDCGYMSRIAFVMDRVFRKFGLSGKSFIPMLVATGCGVPGIMATRTIENEKDRRLTIMVTTFMPCSAKLPIIALIAGAFFPQASWVAPSAYLAGIAAIILSGIALKKSKLFAGDASPFIMELPSYHLPAMKNVLKYALNHAKSFVKRAGTVIFVMNIAIWFLSTYSWSLTQVSADQSILADFGRLMSPLFAPLGWGSWQATVATLTGLVAKETVVGSLGVLYATSGGTDWAGLQAALTPIAAYSFLLFNLLCAPCFAAIGAIHKEMHAFKWSALAVFYQCGLAYAVSFWIFQIGMLVLTGIFTIASALAFIVLALLCYFLFRKQAKTSEELDVLTLDMFETGKGNVK